MPEYQQPHTQLKDYYLDILGQQPGLKIYTQITLCYSLPDTTSHSAIVNKLTHGLERLSASFPWIAGQVVSEGAGEGNTGLFKIEPLEKIPRLVVKDLRENPDAPTMDALRSANFPMSMLDERLIAPRMTLPSSDEAADVTPVFCVQANFIHGGLLLTFVSEHQTMDMTGHGQMMSLLSKACRNEPFTTDELETGNLARRDLVPYLDASYTPGHELDYQVLKPAATGETPSPPKSTWANFSFSAASLASLKAEASESLPDSSKFISTDDAVTSFLWKSVTRARQHRYNTTKTSLLARAVDARSFLGVSKTYPGLLQNMTYHHLRQQPLVNGPLGILASSLRSAIDPSTSDIAYRTRALATLLNRSTDKNIVSFTASNTPASDLALSSWAKIGCYGVDFGLGLGMPVSVRRPRFAPVEGLLYLLPMRPDGEVTVAVCLSDGDLTALVGDSVFARYAGYIG